MSGSNISDSVEFSVNGKKFTGKYKQSNFRVNQQVRLTHIFIIITSEQRCRCTTEIGRFPPRIRRTKWNEMDVPVKI